MDSVCFQGMQEKSLSLLARTESQPGQWNLWALFRNSFAFAVPRGRVLNPHLHHGFKKTACDWQLALLEDPPGYGDVWGRGAPALVVYVFCGESSTSRASLGSRRASQNRIEPHIPGPFSNLANQISSLCEEEFSGDNHVAFGCTGAFIKEGETKKGRQTKTVTLTFPDMKIISGSGGVPVVAQQKGI